MEVWFLLIITLCICALIKSLFNLFFQSDNYRLPPGPLRLPFIGNLFWFRRPFSEIESILRSLCNRLGPVITLYIGPRPTIFVADRSLAYQALVQNGAVFATRPRAPATTRISTNNQLVISSAFYGPTWRLLRRNLTSEILHPSKIKSFSHARTWVLEILVNRFDFYSKSGEAVRVIGHFHYAMFCLLVLMCFGDKLDEKKIEEIEKAERANIVNSRRFDKLNLMPWLTKILFRRSWSEFLKIQREREEVLVPLIRARKRVCEERKSKKFIECDDRYVLAYVDTLFNLQLPDEKRPLTEKEMVSLCNEFLNGGTDTTSTALQWIMANLVKYPLIQEKLYVEIQGVVVDGAEEVKEDDLQKMPYLKAIILEGLRRHPPAHFVLPHAVCEDAILGDYLVPKQANINFMVAEMGWDASAWEDPMVFKPERFMGSDSNGDAAVFDITGSKEIKMMPFGVGRRICPAFGLALLHLEYFLANLVWKFKWRAVDGDDIDLSEKQEFTTVMKHPLQAQISPRFK